MSVLCSIHDIEEESAKGFDVDGKALFVVKKNGQIHVYLNTCPHIGIPLEFLPDEFLDQDKQYIQCANHGALFVIDTGYCVAGPCAGQSLEAIPFTLDGDKIVLP